MLNPIPVTTDGTGPSGAIPINLTGQITPDPVDNPILEDPLPGEATLEDVIAYVNEIRDTLQMFGVISSTLK